MSRILFVSGDVDKEIKQYEAKKLFIRDVKMLAKEQESFRSDSLGRIFSMPQLYQQGPYFYGSTSV